MYTSTIYTSFVCPIIYTVLHLCTHFGKRRESEIERSIENHTHKICIYIYLVSINWPFRWIRDLRRRRSSVACNRRENASTCCYCCWTDRSSLIALCCCIWLIRSHWIRLNPLQFFPVRVLPSLGEYHVAIFAGHL